MTWVPWKWCVPPSPPLSLLQINLLATGLFLPKNYTGFAIGISTGFPYKRESLYFTTRGTR